MLLRVVACPPAVVAEKNAVFVRHVVANLGHRTGQEQSWWNGPWVVQIGVVGFRSAVVFEVSTGPEQLQDLMFGCEAERLCSGWRFCWHRIHTGASFLRRLLEFGRV